LAFLFLVFFATFFFAAFRFLAMNVTSFLGKIVHARFSLSKKIRPSCVHSALRSVGANLDREAGASSESPRCRSSRRWPQSVITVALRDRQSENGSTPLRGIEGLRETRGGIAWVHRSTSPSP
jgi:hypothetical protein